MDKISTTGVIDQTIYSDGGNVMYIVNVELNGNIVKAQSIHYSSKTKSLPNGKKVSVNYWETPKGRNRLVEILDENIVPCKDDLSGDLRLLASFGILVIIVICIFCIKINLGGYIMNNELLPIGSVVLIGNSKKKVMIVGVCQKGGQDPNAIWDYTGVIFPEGYLDAEKMFLFNREQISHVYALGYQDEEQMAFKQMADTKIRELKGE